NNRVQVQVFRTADRSNPVPTLLGTAFGVRSVDIGAVATAEVSPANAETCVMPFTIPDRWIENGTAPWDPTDTFDPGDTYIPLQTNGVSNSDYTGYNAVRDKGLLVTLKASNGSNVTASWYNPWDLPGSVGASDYRANIGGCNSALIHSGDSMTPEPGNMDVLTAHGMA